MPFVLPLIALVFWFDSYRIAATLPPLWAERTVLHPGPGPLPDRLRPVRGRCGRLDGVAGWPPRPDRPAHQRRPARASPPSSPPGPRPPSGRWAATWSSWPRRSGPWPGPSSMARRRTGRSRWAPWGWPRSARLGSPPGPSSPPGSPRPWPRSAGCSPAEFHRRSASSSCSGWALILPTNSNNNFGQDAGIFYQFLPDLPIARVMFLAGVAMALVALLGVPVAAGGLRLRHIATVASAAGAGAGRDRDRTGRDRPRDPLRHGHPGPARRGQRPADPVHPGLRRCRDPGLRAPRLPALAARRDRGAAPGAGPDRRPARRPGPGRSGRHPLHAGRPWPGRPSSVGQIAQHQRPACRCSTCRWAR